MVERYPTPLLGSRREDLTIASPNQEEGFDEAGVHSEGRRRRAVSSTRDAGKAVDAFLETVTDALKARDSINFTGFGKFSAAPAPPGRA